MRCIPALQTFTSIPGFPEQQIWQIQQDSTGFMWMATNGGGLARFDGKNVRLITHRDNDSNTISSNTIIWMKIDHLNRIWLFYHSGSFDLFDPVTEKVRHLSAELHFLRQVAAHASDSIDASQYDVLNFYEDSRHCAWIIMDNLAARIDATGKEPIKFYCEPGYPRREWLVSVNETPDGNLMFASQDKLVETDPHLRVLRKIPLAQQSIKKGWLQAAGFSIRKGDTLYLGGYRGVNVVNMRAGQLFFRGGAFRDIGRYEYGEFDRYTFDSNQPFSFRYMSYCMDRWSGLWHSRFTVFYSSLQQKPYTVMPGVKDYKRQVLKQVWHLPADLRPACS